VTFGPGFCKLWLLTLNAIAILAVTTHQIIEWNYLNPDGLSYLEMGAHTLESGPARLLNLHWSPLYPALISLFLAMFRPDPVHEVAVVHVLNGVIFAADSTVCAWFIWRWLRANWDAFGMTERPALRFIALSTFVYGLFLWTSYEFIYVPRVTPDALVMLAGLAAAACCYGIGENPGSRWRYAALGIVLGLGYWVKAAMLPIGVLFLLVIWISPPGRAMRRRNLILAGATLAVLAAPLILALSLMAGKLTFGESGRLNIAWLNMNIGSYLGFWEGPPGAGIPEHPPRILNREPLVLEFNGPIRATYPLWYDPAYWNAGLKVRVSPALLLAASIRDFKTMREAVTAKQVLNWGLAIMALVRLIYWRRRWTGGKNLWLLGWGIVALAVYLPVFFEPRYQGAAILFLWVAAYGLLVDRKALRYQQVVLFAVGLSLCAPVLRDAWDRPRYIRQILAGRAHPDQTLRAAAQLRSAGLRPGDAIATVGYSFDAGYARVAGLHIVAQVREADEWWKVAPPARETIEDAIRKTGARALVAFKQPGLCLCPGWILVGDSGYFIRPFDPPPAAPKPRPTGPR
jgi:hypothetical protein